MTEQNTPELRFPGINDRWESSTLNQITSILKDGTHGTHKDSKEGPWLLSAKNLKNNKISINEDDRKISKVDFDRIYKNYNLKRGDLLLSIVGTIGNVAIVKDPENIAFQRSVAILRMRNEFYNKFFLNLFQTHSFKKKLKRNQVVSAQPGIYLGDLGKFQIKFPLNLKEQNKIGNFFSKLDRQIELEEEKLELLEKQNHSYINQIFTKQLKFNDDEGNKYPEWITKKLGDIGKVAMNKRIYKNETTESGEIPFYKIGNFGKSADTFITREKFNEYKEKYPYPNVGDILISASGSIGRTIEYTGEDAYYQDSNIVWLDHNDEVLNKYLKYFYKIVKWAGIEGTTIKRLYNKNILNTKIELPNIEEQEKIGEFLTKYEELIKKQSSKVELLKQRKQGLLQKMFV